MEGWSWPGHREWKVAAAGALEKTRLAGWHDGPAPLSAPGEGDAGPALRPHCLLKRDRAPPVLGHFPSTRCLFGSLHRPRQFINRAPSTKPSPRLQQLGSPSVSIRGRTHPSTRRRSTTAHAQRPVRSLLLPRRLFFFFGARDTGPTRASGRIHGPTGGRPAHV